MPKREKPQISPDRLKPLLEFDSIDKGLHIHLPLDQTKSHWQLKTFIVTGIDNEREVLLVTDLAGKPEALPFQSLGAYRVNIGHIESRFDFKKKKDRRRKHMIKD